MPTMKLQTMNPPRFPQPINVSAAPAARAVASSARTSIIEDRDWHASSRDLAQGLIVSEWLETMPAEWWVAANGAQAVERKNATRRRV